MTTSSFPRYQGDLLQLVQEDQRIRWGRGERPLVEDYLQEYSALRDAADGDATLALIVNEIDLRRGRGEVPRCEEYVRRFPQLERQIQVQFEVLDVVHQMIDAEPAYADSTVSGWPYFPGYEIVNQLGQGGMGVVYLAHDRKHNQLVALKTLQNLDLERLHRFQQEFRSAADIRHDNLVTLYDLHTNGQTLFFTMEYIKGEPFLDHVHGGTLAPTPLPVVLGPAQLERLVRGLIQLARGLLALHDAGKIHRDIKPTNVLATPEGRVVLVDFGLAAELDRRGRHDAPSFCGTPAYMAPEQREGRPLSRATDWYSVGVMIHQALYNRLPAPGRSPPRPGSDRAEPQTLADGVVGLEQLCAELLSPDPEQRPDGQAVLRRLEQIQAQLVRPAPASKPAAAGTPFVGRQQHLTALRDAFKTVQQRRTVFVRLEGPSGVGKTALVQHFLDSLPEREAIVLRGRCFEREFVPYKALGSLVDDLSQYLRRLPDTEARAVLPTEVSSLARMFPALNRVRAVAEYPPRPFESPDPQEVQRQAFAALRDLLIRLGDRKSLVLFLDDLQWGDADSAELLSYLLGPRPPVFLLLACARSEAHRESRFLTQLLKNDDKWEPTLIRRQLVVEPLPPEEARELAQELLGRFALARPALAEDIARQSEGSPLFVSELVQHLKQEPGRPERPLTLGEVLWSRVDQLPEEARRLLRVLAVAGQPLQHAEACQAAGVETNQAAALSHLRANRYVFSTQDTVEICHDRLRETILEHLSESDRCRCHSRLAETLERSGHTEHEVLAVHFQKAGEKAQARHNYVLAARQADAELAFDRAVLLYRLALALGPGPDPDQPDEDLRLPLARALDKAGRAAESAQQYLAVIAEAPERPEAFELQLTAAAQFLRSGHMERGLATLQAVFARTGLRLPNVSPLLFLSLLWKRLLIRLGGLSFRERPSHELSEGDRARSKVYWAGAYGLGYFDVFRGAYCQASHFLLARRSGNLYEFGRAVTTEAIYLATAGSSNPRWLNRLLDAATALVQQSHARHDPEAEYSDQMVLMARGVAAYFSGRWCEALETFQKVARYLRERCQGVWGEIDVVEVLSQWARLFRGEVAEFSRLCPILYEEARQRDDLYAVSYIGMMLVEVRLAADDLDGARQALEEVKRRLPPGCYLAHCYALVAEGQLHLYAGQGQAAWDWANGPVAAGTRLLQQRVRQTRIEWRLLHARSALAAAGSAANPGPLLRAAEQDARRLEREKFPWTSALAQLLRAGAAAGRGDRTRAIERLANAVNALEAADLHLYAAAARRRQGELIGGAAGAKLVAQAEAWMTGQEIRNPARMTALLAPGFGR